MLRNGNPVVGEIEELRRGDLSIDTDEMSVVAIDWDDIASVTTTRIFEVTDVAGFQYFGRLEATDQQGTLVVVLGEIADTLVFSAVVEMTYIGQGFFAKTKGYVDVGVNITRANSLASLLLKGRFAYRGQLWDFDYNAEAYFQRQETTTDLGDTFEEETSRTSTSVSVKRFFGGSWAGIVSTERVNGDKWKDECVAMLRGVFETMHQHVGEVVLVEAGFVYQLDGIWLSGATDLIYRAPGSSRLSITDWKTGAQLPHQIELDHGWEAAALFRGTQARIRHAEGFVPLRLFINVTHGE